MSGTRAGRVARRRRLRAWMPAALGGVALVAALAGTVWRGDEGRSLSTQREELRAQAGVIRDRLLAARARADSLMTPGRIEAAAAELGLRRAVGGDMIWVAEDALRSGGDPGEADAQVAAEGQEVQAAGEPNAGESDESTGPEGEGRSG